MLQFERGARNRIPERLIMARIVFMGTPHFAVPTLRALHKRHQVVGVVTQPDRRAGRGRKLILSPVKEAALARDLPLFQPRTLGTPEAVAHLAEWQPDVIVVAAFGQFLLPPVLELPPHGCLNIHPSLLPRYRGASPIPAAILAGDPVTGVTIMRLDEGLDSGPLLAQAERPLAPDATTGTLTAELAEVGARLLVETLPEWLGGEIQAQPQDDALATFCQPLRKEDGHLDWARTAEELDRQVRATDPWPGAYTTWQGRRLKVLGSQPCSGWQGAGRPGEVVQWEPAGLGVVTGEGVLVLWQVQLAGKKPVAAEAFARGQRDLIGALLGT
jgi:methionyl-tRNA formyltransferase